MSVFVENCKKWVLSAVVTKSWGSYPNFHIGLWDIVFVEVMSNVPQNFSPDGGHDCCTKNT